MSQNQTDMGNETWNATGQQRHTAHSSDQRRFSNMLNFDQYMTLHMTFREYIIKLGTKSPVKYFIPIVLNEKRVMWLMGEEQILTYCRVDSRLHRSHSHKPGIHRSHWWNTHQHIHHNADQCIQLDIHTDLWQSYTYLGPLNPQHYSCTDVLCAREKKDEQHVSLSFQSKRF